MLIYPKEYKPFDKVPILLRDWNTIFQWLNNSKFKDGYNSNKNLLNNQNNLCNRQKSHYKGNKKLFLKLKIFLNIIFIKFYIYFN